MLQSDLVRCRMMLRRNQGRRAKHLQDAVVVALGDQFVAVGARIVRLLEPAHATWDRSKADAEQTEKATGDELHRRAVVLSPDLGSLVAIGAVDPLRGDIGELVNGRDEVLCVLLLGFHR